MGAELSKYHCAFRHQVEALASETPQLCNTAEWSLEQATHVIKCVLWAESAQHCTTEASVEVCQMSTVTSACLSN